MALGQNYTFEIIQTNAEAYSWDLGQEGGIQTTASIVYVPITVGQKRLCANVTVFGGVVKSRCIDFVVQISGEVSNSLDIDVSFEDESYDGVNFGKIIKFGGLIWLQNDASVYRKNAFDLGAFCPAGYEPPSLDLYNLILSAMGDDAFDLLTKEAFYNVSFNYLTPNKTGIFSFSFCEIN